jgi:hypothetical protein
MKQQDNKEKLQNMNLVSKPIFFMGLPPLYFIILCLLLLLSMVATFLILKVLTIFVFIPVIVGLIFMLRKLNKAQKEGCPDIISSYQVKLWTKSSYSDQNFLLKYLKNERK